MADTISLIAQLQSDAADSSKPVADMLRLAKVAAVKLGVDDAAGKWIDAELEGYADISAKDLPPYRQIHGAPMAWNPVRGWQPIMFNDSKTASTCSFAPLSQSLPSLEAMLRNGDHSGHFEFEYPPELAAAVRQAMGWQTQVNIRIGYGQIYGVVDRVRNLVLNWSLALEKGGVVGEAMMFTQKERNEAVPISQQYFIQNVGVLGNVADSASVTNTQSAILTLDAAKVRNFLDSLRNSANGLPEDVRAPVLAEAAKMEAQLAANKPNQGVLKVSLETISNVCEQAAGNLVAIGIVSAIKMYFGI